MIQHCVRIAKNVVQRINNAILRVILVFWQDFFVIRLQILLVAKPAISIKSTEPTSDGDFSK